MTLPDPAQDFARFMVFVKHPQDFTPGQIAQHVAIDPDHIGLIAIEAEGIVIDVHKHDKQTARDKLVELGGCKLLNDCPMAWRWLRIPIGRNHGLSMRKLRSLLDDADAAPVGRIHINNTYTAVGLREDKYDAVFTLLDGRTVNGVELRPTEGTKQECGGEPRYWKREEREQRAPRPRQF